MTSYEQENQMSNSNNKDRSEEEYKITRKERRVIKTLTSKLRSVKRQMLLKEAEVTSDSSVDDFRKLIFKITATDNLHDSQRDSWASSSSFSSSDDLHEEGTGAGSWTSLSSLHEEPRGSSRMNTPNNSLLRSFTREFPSGALLQNIDEMDR
jgi:hypothetical protein